MMKERKKNRDSNGVAAAQNLAAAGLHWGFSPGLGFAQRIGVAYRGLRRNGEREKKKRRKGREME